jgi:uncharacterized protein YjbI with pentapeptide repeats
MMRSGAAVLAVMAALGAATAMAQERAPRPSIWDLKPLGRHAAELPYAPFIDYACGTNGGPPSTAIAGWHEYARCAPDRETGLREVYFRYDDEDEYWALANNLRREVFGGTTVFSHPVIVSGLFTDDGFLVGLRVVTDPRADEETRRKSVALLNFFLSLYADAGFRCESLPPGPDETPAGARIIKERCTAESNERRLAVESQFYRKAGQTAFDPRIQGLTPTKGQFWSETRLVEVSTAPIPERAARAERLRDFVPTVSELAVRARNCPGCDFAGVDLKRADLRGANLEGANLEGANLHGAVLSSAKLQGANLASANLNKADLKRADLRGAKLANAMAHEAHFDGANAEGADFTTAAMQRAEFLSANLSRANLTQTDLWEARMGGVNLRGALLLNTWLVSARLQNANFTDASAEKVILYGALLNGANFTNADLRGAEINETDVQRANFANADLRGALLTGTKLLEARFDGARIDGARFPPGYTPNR